MCQLKYVFVTEWHASFYSKSIFMLQMNSYEKAVTLGLRGSHDSFVPSSSSTDAASLQYSTLDSFVADEVRNLPCLWTL